MSVLWVSCVISVASFPWRNIWIINEDWGWKIENDTLEFYVLFMNYIYNEKRKDITMQFSLITVASVSLKSRNSSLYIYIFKKN